MPQGTIHIETGRLMTEDGVAVLLRDDGGSWDLFLERGPGDLMGQRVTIRGERCGFNLLHVTGIARGSEIPPEPQPNGRVRQRIERAVAVTVVAALLGALGYTAWAYVTAILS